MPFASLLGQTSEAFGRREYRTMHSILVWFDLVSANSSDPLVKKLCDIHGSERAQSGVTVFAKVVALIC